MKVNKVGRVTTIGDVEAGEVFQLADENQMLIGLKLAVPDDTSGRLTFLNGDRPFHLHNAANYSHNAVLVFEQATLQPVLSSMKFLDALNMGEVAQQENSFTVKLVRGRNSAQFNVATGSLVSQPVATDRVVFSAWRIVMPSLIPGEGPVCLLAKDAP